MNIRHIIPDIGVEFSLDGNLLTCSTNPSLTVNSIELLDINGQRVSEPVMQTSSLSYSVISDTSMAYICRVHSTLGSQNATPILISTTDANHDTSINGKCTNIKQWS